MYSKLQDGSFIIAGFVAKDAEMKKSQNGKTYTNWSVKVGEKPSAVQGERGEAIWTNCRAWHDAARYAAQIKKGDSVMVVGRIETNEHEGKTYKTLNAEFISIMGKSPAAAQAAPAAETYTDLSQFEEILSDGDVPF
jgi:single-stranded DNA-binding protein